MNWLTVLNEVFNILWLLAILALLWAIWRSSQGRLKHVVTMEHTMLEVARQDAESARKAVEATRILADALQNEQAKNRAKP